MLGTFLDSLFPAAERPVAPLGQIGALPYALVGNRVRFLLVTSRRAGRWIFPKGMPIDGLSPWEAAAREALEEAGVEGEIEQAPIGAYRARKHDPGRTEIKVDLYPLRVIRQLDDWPEMHQRHRHWATLAEVRRLVSERGLADLAARLNRRRGGQPPRPLDTSRG